MAYTESQWEKAKAYYEAGMSLSQIKDKTNIARNTISQRAKREQWEHSKNSDYIEAKIKVETQKGTILEQSGTVALNIADDIALDRAKSITLFQNSAIRNQVLNDKRLEALEKISLVSDNWLLDKDTTKIIDYHAKTTQVNKETVLGKEIDTIINNTNATQVNNENNKLIVEFK